MLTAQVVTVKARSRPRNVIYPGEADPCTERAFMIYQRGDELRIRVPTESQRRLRRFLRDYVRYNRGRVESTNFWMSLP